MEDVIVNNCESKLLFEDCSFDIFLIVVLQMKRSYFDIGVEFLLSLKVKK